MLRYAVREECDEESEGPCIYVWNERREELIKHYIVIDPFSMDFQSPVDVDRANMSGAESKRVEEILNYFRNLRAVIKNPSEVRRYLYRYPEIAELSCFVSEQVYRYFDSNAQLCLDITDDDVPDSEYLAIYLRVPKYDDSVMDRIREIRESYYDSLNNTTGWFLLTTDFSHPR